MWLTGGPPAGLSAEAVEASVLGGAGAEDVSAVGLCRWSFVAPSDEAKRVHRDLHPHDPRLRGDAEWGYIQYALLEVWRLVAPRPKVDIGVPSNDPVAPSLVWDAVRGHAVTKGAPWPMLCSVSPIASWAFCSCCLTCGPLFLMDVLQLCGP